SRRRHTRFSRDWSSDVCSSDLVDNEHGLTLLLLFELTRIDELYRHVFSFHAYRVINSRTSPMNFAVSTLLASPFTTVPSTRQARSEERRVGKECRPPWWASRHN